MSASEAVDTGLIPSRVKAMTFKLVFTASLLHARLSIKGKRGKQADKFTCCVVGKALNRIPPSDGRKFQCELVRSLSYDKKVKMLSNKR